MKIFLTGFPGCGKTHLGKQVAASMKFPFIDTDAVIEKEEGNSIPEIFQKKGEEYFRRKETEVLKQLLKKRKAVISVGGGLPCFHDNMKLMNEKGFTIYLEASAAFLFHRLLKEKKSRPLISHLTDVELMIYITETLSSRREWYAQSQLKVNAENYTPAKLVGAIKKESDKKIR